MASLPPGPSPPPRPPYDSLTMAGEQETRETADAMLRASLASHHHPPSMVSNTMSPEITTSASPAVPSPNRFSFRRITSAMSLRSPSPAPTDQLPEIIADPLMFAQITERLRQLELERDVLRAAAERERARALDMERAAEEERAIAERIKREAAAGPSGAEIELRLLQLRYDALVAGADAKPRITDGLFKSVCSTDLLFLMDTTGSMGSYIDAAKTQVKTIMEDITTAFFGEATVRIAVAGYKDHKDKPNVQFLDFTADVDKVRNFLDELKATGGDDEPEDVLGGLRQALNATWKQQTRCIIHIADAPPHGKNLHDNLRTGGKGLGRDDYEEPGSEPHKLTYEPLIKQMVGLNINYALLRINSSTDRMAFEFLKTYAANSASAHCKVLKKNVYHADARRTITPQTRSSSKRSGAKAGLQFEEVELGTTYNALRHLVVKSVTTSASRTAVRAMEGGLGKLDPELEAIKEDEDDDDFLVKPKPALDLKWDANSNGDTLVKSITSGPPSASAMFKTRYSKKDHADVDKSVPKWDTPGWLDEILVAEAFSTNLSTNANHSVSKITNPLDKMLASDEEMNNQISTNELTIHKRSQPFAQGAMRVAAYARTANSTNKLVVKTFKKGGKGLAHLVEDMWCQALCKAFALEFNALVANQEHLLDFIMVTCLKPKSYTSSSPHATTETRTGDIECLTLEPYIEGTYIKYNSNSGYVNDLSDPHPGPSDTLLYPDANTNIEATNAAAQAFSHFTFERSRGQFLISDLQGVGSMLTDPAIHSRNPNRFKLADTNLGEAGFKFFFATHVCNDVCESLGLKSTAKMIISGNYEFRGDWSSPAAAAASGSRPITSTVCCSNKLCSRIVRIGKDGAGASTTASTNFSKPIMGKSSTAKPLPPPPPSGTVAKFLGYFWCDTCYPQLESSMVKLICVARNGPHHEFEVSRFFYESQGQVPPRLCPGHMEDENYMPTRWGVTGLFGSDGGEKGEKDAGAGEGTSGKRSLVRRIFGGCLPARAERKGGDGDGGGGPRLSEKK